MTRVWLTAALAATAFAQPESIVTTWLPQAVINKSYSFTLMAAPGSSPAWSLAQGALPSGLSLSASGVISGVPDTLGANFFLIRASDPVYGVAYEALELDVVLGPLNIANNALPIATQDVPYSATLQGEGGVPPYKWSFASTVTLGMTLNSSTGTLSGTPANSGAFGLPITVTDSIGKQLSRAYTLLVAAPLSVLTSSLPNGAAGVAYSQSLTAGGGQAPYSWSASGLPAGLQINASTGQITGIPAANGTSAVNVQVTDNGARTASRTLVLTIGPGVVIMNTLLEMGGVGTPYSQKLVATGGQAPYTWSLGAGGSLPPGLSLNAATGVISGTPQDAASLTFSVKATDALGDSGYATFTINILAPLRIIITSTPPAIVGAQYSQNLSATGGQAPYRWSSANLPAGLSIDGATGVISGTLATAGSSTVAVTVSDSLKHAATQAMVVTAATSPVPTITIGGLPASPGYEQQPAITVSLASPYSAALSGTLSLSFTSSVGGGDSMIQFGPGGTSAAFTIAAGSTQAQFSSASSVTVLTGTVAGTITLTVSSLTAGGASVLPSPAPSATITTNPTVPSLKTVTFATTAGAATVTVTGFSSARDMTNGVFQFAPATGATISTGSVNVSLASAFSTWYQSSTSTQYGSEFTLTVPFSVQGDAGDVIAVTVTLTNSKGTSISCASGAGATTTCSSSTQ